MRQAQEALLAMQTCGDMTDDEAFNKIAKPKRLTRECMPFEKVFENGKSKTKYEIMRFKQHYYIFRCKKCRVYFQDLEGVYEAAVKHLHDDMHMDEEEWAQFDADYFVKEELITAVIDRLGVEVLDCTDKLALANNRVYFRAMLELIDNADKTPRAGLRRQKAASRRSEATKSDEIGRHNHYMGRGPLYAGFVPPCLRPLPVIVLPLPSTSDISRLDMDRWSQFTEDEGQQSVTDDEMSRIVKNWTPFDAYPGRDGEEKKYDVVAVNADGSKRRTRVTLEELSPMSFSKYWFGFNAVQLRASSNMLLYVQAVMKNTLRDTMP